MPRAMWSGSISFGLVTIPVKLYSAIRQKDVSFHQVDEKTGARVRYKRVSAKTGREVPYDQIVKGYEVGDDEYVIIQPEELEALDPEKTQRIDIEDFVSLDEIDPIYYERTYYIAPDKGGDKAYSLLLKAMEDAGKIGIGRVVLRTKQYLCAVRPFGKALALGTMLYPDEVVPASEIKDLPSRLAKVGDREMKMAQQLIGSLTAEFDPKKYHDTYRERVLELIDKKSKGDTVRIEEEEAEETTKVVDLLDALKRSVDETGKGKDRKSGSKRRSSRRKSA